jgi:lysyl-tRNA synthetase class 1
MVHRVATGITPSGPIHIGNMREVLTGDMVYKALRDRGVQAELLYVADDFDPLRKVYPFLPESYAEYVGRPLSDIPCPCGDHASYAAHFLSPFLSALTELDITPRVFFSSREYRTGAYTAEIAAAMSHAAEIRRILERVSGRTMPADWSPFYPVCSVCKKISQARILEHDEARHSVRYHCTCGNEGTADYAKGEGKLVWRVDWPMRWAHFGITVEPFGKDHATAGGSYDTGKEIVRKVYHCDPPHPVVYEWISLKGKGAMHSSKGVVVTINEMLEIVPPDVLRYLIARSKPEKAIDFDPGIGLTSLIDEYDRVSHEGSSREFQLSKVASIPTRIPFRHMVTVVQIAHNDRGVLQCLARSGYDISRAENVLAQAERVRAWLRKYAPDQVKFSVKDQLPARLKEVPRKDLEALRSYTEFLERMEGWGAEEIHNGVYEVAKAEGVDPKQIFEAVYLAFLGQHRGPRLGWFLEALGRDAVMRRLHEAGILCV